MTQNPKISKLRLQSWRARPKADTAVYPSLYTIRYASGKACLKEYGAKLKSVICIINRDDFIIVLNSKVDFDKFGAIFISKFKREPRYLDDLIKWSQDNINIIYDYIEQNLNQNIIRTLTNTELSRRYQEYIKIYSAYCFKNIPAW